MGRRPRRGLRVPSWWRPRYVLLLLVAAVVLTPLTPRFLMHPTIFVSGNSGTGSMRPFVEAGDWFLWRGTMLGAGDIERGDVIAFTYDDGYEVHHLMKRVIGLPGETVQAWGDEVFINGEPIEEPYLEFEHSGYYGVVGVGQGQYFVMGDNRPESWDSRFFGPIDAETVDGRVIARAWPPSRADLLPLTAMLLINPFTIVLGGCVLGASACSRLAARKNRTRAWGTVGFFLWGPGILLVGLALPPARRTIAPAKQTVVEIARMSRVESDGRASPFDAIERLPAPVMALVGLGLVGLCVAAGLLAGGNDRTLVAFVAAAVGSGLWLYLVRQQGFRGGTAMLIRSAVPVLAAYPVFVAIRGDATGALSPALMTAAVPMFAVSSIMGAQFGGRHLVFPGFRWSGYIAGQLFWQAFILAYAPGRPMLAAAFIAAVVLPQAFFEWRGGHKPSLGPHYTAVAVLGAYGASLEPGYFVARMLLVPAVAWLLKTELTRYVRPIEPRQLTLPGFEPPAPVETAAAA